MKEVCGCGASLEMSLSSDDLRGVRDVRLQDLMDFLVAWREGHRHEFAPEPAGGLDMPPTVHESGSSHERSWQEPSDMSVRIGFQAA